MLDQNREPFESLNIPAWADYTGGLVLTFERFPVSDWMEDRVLQPFDGVVPFQYSWNDDRQLHGFLTASTFLEVNPDATLVQCPFNYRQSSTGAVSGFLVDTLLPWIMEHKPIAGFRSIKSPNAGLDSVFGPVSEFCVLGNAAGNDGPNDYAALIRDAAWLGIGNAWYNRTDKKWYPYMDTSESEYVDYCGYGFLSVKGKNGMPVSVNGTSFAAPFFTAQASLVQNFFIRNIGRPLSLAEFQEFVKPYLIDIDVPGKDRRTGYGMFKMPDPASIDISKYITKGVAMKKTNIGLIEYARTQLGRPYWMGTFGQIATYALYTYNKGRLPEHYTANDFPSQFGQRVHDCIGLVKGYLWSDGPDAPPVYCAEPCRTDHSADSMLAACKEKGPISNLPEIPGVLVFMPEHVGVYIGGGWVIEARGHAYGVVQTRLQDRPWKYWGKCPYIDYIEEETDMRYNTLAEIPEWGKPTIQKLIDRGALKGTGEGLNLSEDMLRMFVINDRMGLYGEG